MHIAFLVFFLLFADFAQSQPSPSKKKKPNESCSSCSGCTVSVGVPGTPGTPGTPGAPGNHGNPGRDGPTGPTGLSGQRGSPGPLGEKGSKGDPGQGLVSRWKQCTWKNTNSNLDNGKIHECDYNKKFGNTYLRVVYQGTLRIMSCSRCCKRWYFTFNGQECQVPMAIDGVVYQNKDLNIHRVSTIEGYCGKVGVGAVKVEFHIQDCAGSSGDGYTSWNSVSRIVIEEVPPPVQ